LRVSFRILFLNKNFFRREALGRYYVLFAEDNLKRVLPPSGVLAISFLNEGDEVLLKLLDLVFRNYI
jgi:hypothetical protein